MNIGWLAVLLLTGLMLECVITLAGGVRVDLGDRGLIMVT